jgi:exonuclease SbcD
VHISGTISYPLHPLIIHDASGPVYFYSFPYIEPPSIREQTGDNSIRDYQDAYSSVLTHIREIHPRGIRSVLCAHATVLGATVSDSERPLSIGGSETVDVSTFNEFSYVALGHLHRRQWQGESVHYAGSLMKYSFSEADHQKSITMVEIDKNGSLHHDYISLTAKRDVRVVRGFLEEILVASVEDSSRDDYIMAVLENSEPQLDAMGKLRQVYPNILHIERPRITPSGTDSTSSLDHRKMTDLQLFDAFFRQTTGNSLTIQQALYFESVIDTLSQQEREAQ